MVSGLVATAHDHVLVALHRIFRTDKLIAPLVKRCLDNSSHQSIIDLCSGGSGPMRDVLKIIRAEAGYENVSLTLSDLYPNTMAATAINQNSTSGVTYKTESVDATNVDLSLGGVRTMICSLHHMPPEVAHMILQDAAAKKQPICVFEISDNSPPIWGWWVGIPMGIVAVLFLSVFIRPVTWRQLFFTYIIPILPLLIAWDGAVSNARTYTKNDLEILLRAVDSKNYKWEIGSFRTPGNPLAMLYIVGLPDSIQK